MCVCVLVISVSDSFQPRGLHAGLLCPWNSSGRNPGVGSQSVLPGIFADPKNKPGSAALLADSLLSEPPVKPTFIHSLC